MNDVVGRDLRTFFVEWDPSNGSGVRTERFTGAHLARQYASLRVADRAKNVAIINEYGERFQWWPPSRG